MNFRTEYNYDSNETSQQTGLRCTEDEDLAQQQFRDDADINTIVAKFGIAAAVPPGFQWPEADVTGVPNDYATAVRVVEETQTAFMQLPGELRARFQNNPQMVLNWVHDDKNYEEAQKLGLLRLPPEQTRDTTKPLQPAADTKGPAA